jgi:hypothetical protein
MITKIIYEQKALFQMLLSLLKLLGGIMQTIHNSQVIYTQARLNRQACTNKNIIERKIEK